MRIITGIARGRRLEAPAGSDTVRPTTDKVKEAIFSMIQFDIESASVLDLFAGSGQLGLEALSRGAERAIFVDMAHSSYELCKRNVSACGFDEISKVYKADYKAFLLGNTESFDLVFLDPPYSAPFLSDAILTVSKKVSEGGIIVCEHSPDAALPELPDFSRKTRSYGKLINVTLYRKEAAE